jgi:6-phosphogluconate dehydrogenase
MRSSALGLMGLGVMGANLARNLAGNGARLALFDTAAGVATPLAKDIGEGAVGADDIAGLIEALPAPRSIMLMVPAGQPVDDALEALRPHLNGGDIVIDGGNSFYRDTQRRQIEFARQGVHVLGFGVSGGAEGALKGPAIMAGGETAAVASVAPLFEAIAAEAPDGSACFARVGAGAAGHFVKAVHNGIEYAHMQLIAETWHLLRRMVGLSHDETRTIFARWAESELSSFLMECAVQVLDTRDPESGVPLIERVVDTAEQKGTGQWTANAALAYGVAAPTLAEAVHARCLSALKSERLANETALGPSTMAFAGDRMALTAALGRALLAANIAVLAQGFALMRAADQEEGWGVDLATVARVWRGGCIVRSELLEPIAEACASLPAGTNLLRAPALWRSVSAGDASWRQVVVTAIAHGVPVPAFASALSYVDALRTGRLWADMIAAQRDVFGQHGFTRLDKPGRHHADWAAYDGGDKG